jgi:hypothetical protein
VVITHSVRTESKSLRDGETMVEQSYESVPRLQAFSTAIPSISEVQCFGKCTILGLHKSTASVWMDGAISALSWWALMHDSCVWSRLGFNFVTPMQKDDF